MFPFRKLLLPALAISLACTPATAAQPYSAKAPKGMPNILLFLVDDMGVMDSSAPFLTDTKGKPVKHPLNEYYHTPAMERLAGQGLRYSQFYANSVCSPTRVTLMTGQSSARHTTTQYIKPESKNTGTHGPADWNWKGLTKSSITLPRILRQAGYRTIHSGKAHFAPKGHEGENPQVFGFDVNIAGCAYGLPGCYYGTKNFGKGGKRAVPGLEAYHGKEIFLTEALTLEINKELTRAVEEKKPFFAYMSHYAVHSPFQSDPRFADRYKDSGKPAKAQAYATMIEGMDKSLGDIIAKLEQLGVAEDTLVLFLGDNGSDAPLGATHGYSSSAPLRGKKGTHYEGGMRVPFIAAWAKPSDSSELQKKFPIKPGTVHDSFASICDIFPTLLELAAAKPPPDHKNDGHSLWKSFAGKPKDHPQKFLMHFPHSHRSNYFTVYREDQWKLVYHYQNEGDKRYELFDLTEDPYEKDNLASSKPKALQSMIAAMQRELKAAGAQYPLSKDKSTELLVH